MLTIAARARLGVGTIYRRFAGKDALLGALAQSSVEEMDQVAGDAVVDPDSSHGLRRFLDFVGAFNAEKRRCADRIGPATR